MQTMCWASKFAKVLFFLLLGSGLVNNAYAGAEITWLKNKGGQVRLLMADGAAYDMKLHSDVSGVFYDRNKHELGEGEYVSLFQVLPSNTENPVGLCGAGNEIWLHVYRITGAALAEMTRILVSSCLRSISMASQNSGEEMQDHDFSSVQWNLHGFSIEWFDNLDAAGRSLQLSNFVLCEGAFLQQDVLSQESPKK
jgi:hypothetical protein